MLARALAQQTPIILLDEPTAFLDLPRRIEIMHLLRDLAHDTGRAFLISIHDLELALRFADELWLMAANGTLTVGTPEEVRRRGDLLRVPMIPHILPEEDNIAALGRHEARSAQVRIALIAYPYASNFDEFDPLRHEEGVALVPVRVREPLDDYDAIILPGSKNTAASLRYLLRSGLAAEVVRAARRGAMIYGVCGGMQMLGRALRDPAGLEGGDMAGLGLLDVTTELRPHKVTCQRTARWLDGGAVCGYEIHHGVTVPGPRARPHLAEELGWQQDNVIGVYLHDLFTTTAYRQWWLSSLGWRGQTQDWAARLDAEFDRVAGLVMTPPWARLAPRAA